VTHVQAAVEQLKNSIKENNDAIASAEEKFKNAAQALGEFDEAYYELLDAKNAYDAADAAGNEEAKTEALKRMQTAYAEVASGAEAFGEKLNDETISADNANTVIKTLTENHERLSVMGMSKMEDTRDAAVEAYEKIGVNADEARSRLIKLGESFYNEARASVASATAEKAASTVT